MVPGSQRAHMKWATDALSRWVEMGPVKPKMLNNCMAATVTRTLAHTWPSAMQPHLTDGLKHLQMHRGLLLVGAILLTAFMAPGVRAQHTPIDELKYFEKVRTVRFDEPDTLLIGSIDRIDIDPAGRWLIVDRKGEQVLLFDATGTLLASLDPRTCHPGFTFWPMGAKFGSDEFILVLNSNAGQWGYRFTTEGACLGSVDREFVMPVSTFLDIDPTGALYGAYVWPDREMRYMSAAGQTLMEFPLPPSKYPNADLRFSTGGLIADGAHLFYASALGPDILKIALDGTLVGRISERSSWFRSPRRDLPSDLPSGISRQAFKVVGEWVATATPTWSIFELTDQTFMVQYTNGNQRGVGYQVFTKDGKLVAEELGLQPLFIHGENGLVYHVVHPGMDSQGELPNPYVDVYQFVAP